MNTSEPRSPEVKPDWPPTVWPLLETHTSPGEGAYYALPQAAFELLSRDLGGVGARKAMVWALGQGIWPLRFKANRGILTAEQQARLLESRVAVIGCGGLGGGVITLLARFGVGALTLCDGDAFEESNLNRQLLSREDRLGQNKALAAQEDLALMASHVEATAHPIFAWPENLPKILAGADLVMDCLDDIGTRRTLESAAHNAGLTFIHGAVAGLEGLALVSRPGISALAKMYGFGPIRKERAAENLLGVPTVTPTLIAGYQVFLAVSELLGRGEAEPGLWRLDLTAALLEVLRV